MIHLVGRCVCYLFINFCLLIYVDILCFFLIFQMARKRRRGSPHYISSDSEGDSDFDNLAHCNDEYDVSPKAHAINLGGSEVS